MVSPLLRICRIWTALALAAVRAEFQYRTNVAFGILGGLVLQCVGLAFIGTILARFEHLGGWTLPELTLLYGMRLSAHGLWTIAFAPLLNIDLALREGDFDRYLTRPVPSLVQLATRRFALSTVSDLFGGLAILAVGMATCDVDWSAALLGFLLLALLGGAMVELSVQVFTAALALRFLNTFTLKSVLDTVFNTLGNYPGKIFWPTAQWCLTIGFPLAFVAYFPAAALLGRSAELWVSPWVAWAAPVVGALLLAGSLGFWRSQIRWYASNGS